MKLSAMFPNRVKKLKMGNTKQKLWKNILVIGILSAILSCFFCFSYTESCKCSINMLYFCINPMQCFTFQRSVSWIWCFPWYYNIRKKVKILNAQKTGSLIGAIRKEQNRTQQDLENGLGVSSAAVSKWERGIGFLLNIPIKILTVYSNVRNGGKNGRLFTIWGKCKIRHPCRCEPDTAEGWNNKSRRQKAEKLRENLRVLPVYGRNFFV